MPNRGRSSLPGLLCALFLVLSAFLPMRIASAAGSTFVFFEKFPSDNPRQWNVQNLTDGSRTYIDAGIYHILRPIAGTMRGWPLNVKVPAGFQFNVQLRLVKGSDPYEGISFWDDLANNFFLLAITPDGKVGLFEHGPKGYKIAVSWQRLASLHRGIGAVNTISVNMDNNSASLGRTFLINGVALGKPCNNPWRRVIGHMPSPPMHGLFVGVVAGSYKGSTMVDVLRASMYDGTHAGPVHRCPRSH